MNKPFFSIIVPVYKVEQYLNQCVESVLGQTFKDFELILVDDGSPDGCPKMCDDYAAKDERIKVVHKDNGGLSSARNAGVRVANGEYLLFLDSDDYWETSADLMNLFLAIQNIEEPDVIVFAAKLLYPNGDCVNDPWILDNKYYPANIDSLKKMISSGMIIGSACTKVVKRSFFVENDLYFVEGLKSEDIEWIFRVSTLLPSYYFYDRHFYIYRQMREGSITNTVDPKHIVQYYGTVTDFCERKDLEVNVKEVFYNYVAYHFSLLCALVANMKDKSEKKDLTRKLKPYSWLMKYNMLPRMKKISLFYCLFGFYITFVALGVAMKFRNMRKF